MDVTDKDAGPLCMKCEKFTCFKSILFQSICLKVSYCQNNLRYLFWPRCGGIANVYKIVEQTSAETDVVDLSQEWTGFTGD